MVGRLTRGFLVSDGHRAFRDRSAVPPRTAALIPSLPADDRFFLKAVFTILGPFTAVLWFIAFNHLLLHRREKRLFFAQLGAALTIIFLTEARPDFLQGIEIPRDDPSDDRKAEGYAGFLRYACKMATGGGKTTVMGMLASWSILNKVNNRGDARFSDVVLMVRPNVTISAAACRAKS